jgi:hypothetical protein
MRIKFSIFRIIAYVICFLTASFIPLEYIEGRSFCIFYNLFGITCLGCGTTRAVFNVIHFNFIRALQFNFIAVIWFSFLLLVIIQDIFISFKLILTKKTFDFSIIEKFLYRIKFFQLWLSDKPKLNNLK